MAFVLLSESCLGSAQLLGFSALQFVTFSLEHHGICKEEKSCPPFGRNVGILGLSPQQTERSWQCCFSSRRIQGSGKRHPWKWCSSCGHRSARSQIWQSFKWTHPGELSTQGGINNCTLQLLHLLGIINMNSCSSVPGCDADGVNWDMGKVFSTSLMIIKFWILFEGVVCAAVQSRIKIVINDDIFHMQMNIWSIGSDKLS